MWIHADPDPDTDPKPCLFSSSLFLPKGAGPGYETGTYSNWRQAGAQTNELPYATAQCYICYTLFRKESGEGSAAYQDQLLEATALLLRTRDVRAKSADLENKGIGVASFFMLLCRALI